MLMSWRRLSVDPSPRRSAAVFAVDCLSLNTNGTEKGEQMTDRKNADHLVQMKLRVNEKDFTVTVQPDIPLLWVLREELGLTGTKFGCGISRCGACTVHVDGEAVRSCSLPASRVVGKAVTTIEGLSPTGDHPVQQAWMEEDVPQCGYCHSGQIMRAAALLARNFQPSDADIDAAMSGNVCRCGTYQRIRRAIHRASRMMGGM
jgi:aerobic-type carbon monoxide dehydrogenase small subunit (CoxS/CutS family)